MPLVQQNMNESFCHQPHGSAYSYIPANDDGQAVDGMDRTSGKGLRLIPTHAITRYGPLGALDEEVGLHILLIFTSSAKEKGIKVEILETSEIDAVVD